MIQLVRKIYHNHSLAPYTSWRIGGDAKVFVQPVDLQDLQSFLQKDIEDEKIYCLGAASNVLIADSGVDGVVIYLKDRLNKIEKINNNLLRVEAGLFCPKFSKYCQQNSIVDGAFLAGIPGTIGGALAMNAGAFGSEIWQFVTAVETINRHGKITVRSADEFTVSYRHVDIVSNEWFVAGHFSFAQGDYDKVARQIDELMRKRRITQPLGEYSGGSVFRNPANDYAGRLIEQCGLKGKVIGKAKISEKHANFIVNMGSASADDVLQLISLAKQKVREKFGILLELEVKIWGI